MCRKRAHTLASLTKLYSTKVDFKLSEQDHTESVVMTKIVGIYYLLSWPNFSEEFVIHMDDIKTQLRGEMFQKIILQMKLQ